MHITFRPCPTSPTSPSRTSEKLTKCPSENPDWAQRSNVVDLETERADLSSYGEVITAEGNSVTLRVPKTKTADVTGKLLANLPVINLTVEDPPIEEVIEQVFSKKITPAHRHNSHPFDFPDSIGYFMPAFNTRQYT